MTPAGDCKHSQSSMDQTFYLTNIVPQDPLHNSRYMAATLLNTV